MHQAMLASHNLSSAKEIYVIARLSKSGLALPQQGDIESKSLKIRLSKSKQTRVKLMLS